MVNKIIAQLPHNLDWMVMFRLEKIKNFTDDKTIIEMYFLSTETKVSDYDFVVLTSNGRFLYNGQSDCFYNGETLEKHTFEISGLYSAYKERIDFFDLDKADSFATGDYPGYGKVVLYIELGDKIAYAKSIFTKPPSTVFYDYLQAVGIRYISGEYVKENLYMTTYENTLSKHISSGILANFSRTDNCNLFFLVHGNINEFLAHGIITAGEKRISHEKHALRESLISLTKKVLETPLKMEVLQPFGEPSFLMGDVVPKGFLYGAMQLYFPDEEITKSLEKSLLADKLRGLWTFEKDDLETSIDSAFVLMNYRDKRAAELISKFEDKETAGYLPQIDSSTPNEGEMQYVKEKDHWCQPDIAVSALILGLQNEMGLPYKEKLVDFVVNNFEQRSGLYTTNPYFVDWIYAKGLVVSKNQTLIDQLKEEILSSVNEDYSVGKFDKVFSTACAALALQELGCSKNLIFGLQLYVLNNYRNPMEQQPIPFYSSLIIPSDKQGRTCQIGDTNLSIYLYKDIHNIVYLSLVAQCLQIDTIGKIDISDTHTLTQFIDKQTSERYGFSTREEFIQFELANYV